VRPRAWNGTRCHTRHSLCWLSTATPLTRESYLNINNVDEDDLDAEQESELPHLFQESMIEERVASVMFEIEIDDTLRQLSEGAR
jgi:hypothetical protein